MDTEDIQHSQPKGWWAKGALLVLSTVLALLLAEGFLRVYFWSQGVGRKDVHELLQLSREAPLEVVDTRGVFGIVQPSSFPDVVYELRPNLRGTFRGKTFSTNSFGLRSPDVSRDKAPSTFRIAGLGDSHMFGWGVHQNETYLARLQSQLETEGHSVETLNFAAPGYNTAIEAAVFERKARHFAPDLVILHFIGNDLNLPHHLQPPRSLKLGNWYLLEMLRSTFAKKALDGELELLPHNLKKVSPEVREAARGRYAYMVGEEGYRNAMDSLVTRAQELEIPILLLTLGQRELVSDVAAKYQLPLLDASAVFLETLEAQVGDTSRDAWKRAFKIPKDGHPTPLAHEAYAEALLREFSRLGLISE